MHSCVSTLTHIKTIHSKRLHAPIHRNWKQQHAILTIFSIVFNSRFRTIDSFSIPNFVCFLLDTSNWLAVIVCRFWRQYFSTFLALSLSLSLSLFKQPNGSIFRQLFYFNSNLSAIIFQIKQRKENIRRDKNLLKIKFTMRILWLVERFPCHIILRCFLFTLFDDRKYAKTPTFRLLVSMTTSK